ncbi:MAG: tetratricopeptide repeat protein [Halieaceae bacterium]|jgi:Flp pilus assembly protein TadD|nr:tetratricopeptide repeat protein [Halieaceae bacterium]
MKQPAAVTGTPTARLPAECRRVRVVWRCLLLACCASLLGCAHQRLAALDVAKLPPLQVDSDSVLAPTQALAATDTPALLELGPDMRDFVDRYVQGDQRQRLRTLHRSLLSPALVGIEYDPAMDGTAAEIFEAGAANCLSYAHLFIALARYAGLDAHYLSLSLRPEWSRHGSKIALRQHVSVEVALRNGERYVVDIDPVSRERIAHAEVLTDRQAFALYHGNLAMQTLFSGDAPAAYGDALRAVSLAPDIDFLWANLGALYRQQGQDDVAEQLYLTALEVNPDSRTAMNNLAVLYRSRGDQVQADAWAARVERRRQQNPFYHYYLGETAEAGAEYEKALSHYQQAIVLRRSEAEFYFRVARLYLQLGQREASRLYVQQAIAHARLAGERESYEAFLRALNGDSLASAPPA